MKLTDKAALVTGSSHGTGVAVAWNPIPLRTAR
jgi:NAD(P)-dependent dehydrogenase (short-subunit alcohol dehydrogenase family)